MLHGDISSAPARVVAFDFADLLLPLSGVRKLADSVLGITGLNSLRVAARGIDPSANRVFEHLGISRSLSVYVVVHHGECTLSAASKKTADLWISRVVLMRSLSDINRFMNETPVLCYYSSVIQSRYKASVRGVEVFPGWNNLV